MAWEWGGLQGEGCVARGTGEEHEETSEPVCLGRVEGRDFKTMG